MGQLRPPVWQRGAIRAASLLVPRRARPAWCAARQHNLAAWRSILEERGELRENQPELARYALQSFPVAAATRWDLDEQRLRLSQWPRHPSFVPLLLAILLGIAALLSGAFSGTRSLLLPLPYADSHQVLVLTQKARSFGTRVGVTAEILKVWRREETGLEGLAAYLHRSVKMTTPDGDTRTIRATAVSPDFFLVLKAPLALGPGFTQSEDLPEIVLSHALWRSQFAADAHVIGDSVAIDGAARRIVGVAAPDFWFLSPDRQMWIPLSLSHPPPPPPGRRLILGGVGRIADPAHKEAAERKLRSYAVKLGTPTGGRMAELWPLGQVLKQPLVIYGAGLLAAAGLAVLLSSLVFWQAGRASKHGIALGGRLRPPLYFLGKTLFALALCGILWLEVTTTLRRSAFAFNNMGAGWFIGWSFFLSCAGVLYWSWRDQRRRCPICLRRLSMPVRIGHWGSSLFEPVTTELLCEKGHGSLSYSEVDSSSGEPGVWQPMDESWQDLFASPQQKPRN